jgi:ribose transport system substrate-binding protein
MANASRSNMRTRPAPGRIARTTLLLLLPFIAAEVVGIGCERKEPTATGKTSAAAASGAPKAKQIGVSLLTVQHQFYQDLRAGLQEEAEKHGYKLLITTAEFDPARQANQVDEFIVQKVDAIVVCPCDSRSVGACIVQANEAGIPVFTADIASTSPIGEVVSHIASDNKQGGREAARLLLQALGGKGKVAILSHPEVTSVMDRVAGFKEEIARHPDIQIVAELSAGGKRDKANRVMEDLLQSHPDLDGVFGINDDSALGALAAIEAAGKTRQVRIVGYDATPEAREKIKAGGLYGDVIQNPGLIGRLTILTIHDHLGGKEVAAVIPVEVGTYTGESG